MKRTYIVELVVDEETEKKLRQLCDLSSKLWNEVNYVRLRIWLEKKGIDFDGTYKEFYEKYKPLIGSATAQQILNKNNNAWRSFFRLLELKREGRLPPFITKVSPPGYKKKRKSRMLWAVLRKDQCEVAGDRIILKFHHKMSARNHVQGNNKPQAIPKPNSHYTIRPRGLGSK